MKGLNNTLQDAYRLSDRDHLDPRQVLTKLQQNDATYS
jgi:hypothetical protein